MAKETKKQAVPVMPRKVQPAKPESPQGYPGHPPYCTCYLCAGWGC